MIGRLDVINNSVMEKKNSLSVKRETSQFSLFLLVKVKAISISLPSTSSLDHIKKHVDRPQHVDETFR